MTESYVLLVEKEKCCGCTACAAVCPVNAISMQEDSEGFVYPAVNNNTCVECGKCKEICPINGRQTFFSAQEAYAAINQDEAILQQSSSGGVFSALAESVISEGGAVCGAILENNVVRHIITESYEGISLMRGSKYVQSDLGDVITEVLEKLSNGQKVLFSGTPCQCSGLRNIVGDNNNLLTVDFVCHGVPSPALLSDYVNWLNLKTGKNILLTGFRAKEANRMGVIETLQIGEKTVKLATYDSPYLTGFLKGIFNRPSCYQCPFAREERVNDITICDYWGVEKIFPELDPLKGVSAVIISSERGKKQLEKAKTKLYLRETSVNDISSGNANLLHATKLPPERDKFYCERNTLDFDSLVKKYLTDENAWKKRFVSKIPKSVKKAIKKLMGRI